MAATARRSGNYTNGNQTPVSGLVCTQFDHCNKFEFEGVVSKRLASRYSGGPSRNWVKSKCPGWKRINAERYRLFEGPPRKPELTEAQKTLAKKRQELARVIERLRSPPLSHGTPAS